MLLRQGESLDVAEPAVIGLGDHRQMEGLGSAVAHRKGRNGVADDADLVGVGDPDRRAEQALLREPRKAGHLAVAVERERPGEHVVGPNFRSTRPDGGDPRAGNPRTILDDRRVAHFDARHVGNGVERAGRQRPDLKTEIAQAGTGHGRRSSVWADARTRTSAAAAHACPDRSDSCRQPRPLHEARPRTAWMSG
jgi:hypothetical protein